MKCKERKYYLQFTSLSLSMSGKKNLHEKRFRTRKPHENP